MFYSGQDGQEEGGEENYSLSLYVEAFPGWACIKQRKPGTISLLLNCTPQALPKDTHKQNKCGTSLDPPTRTSFVLSIDGSGSCSIIHTRFIGTVITRHSHKQRGTLKPAAVYGATLDLLVLRFGVK